jgi:predicted Zn-dependent protease
MMYSEDLSVRGLTNLYGSVILMKNNPYFEKVLIHEMGHVLGLRHCENLACVMAIRNDAEGTEKFCEQCIRLVPEGALRNRKASTLNESEEVVSVAEGELDELN